LDVVASSSQPSTVPPQRPGEDALASLISLLQGDLEACNHTIVARMDSPVTLIPQLAAHIVAAGGKRLRPLLTLACARMCGYQGQRHVKLAACVEFIHTATLLHDDVVDESLLRRGMASANAVFGNQASVLVGDFLFARAFQLIDDALDYSAKQEALGKTVGDDFREGKITLPVILAYLRGDAEERSFWQRVMEQQEQRPDDLAKAIALMTRHAALKDTVARAAHYGAMAKDALGIFPDSAEKRALIEVVDFCIQRGH